VQILYHLVKYPSQALIASPTQDDPATAVVEAPRSSDIAVQTASFDIEAQEYPKGCIGDAIP